MVHRIRMCVLRKLLMFVILNLFKLLSLKNINKCYVVIAFVNEAETY